jgi:4-hydroxybenzoate polyprenyltransferase
MYVKPARRHVAARIGNTLLATHLLPSILVTTMTTTLAYGSGQRASLWLLVPAVLFGQFCIGWTNDYLDRYRDRAAGRLTKPIVSGAVRASTIRNLAVAALAAAILFSLAYSIVATVIYVVALASALLYNFRLKNSVLSIVTYVVSFGLLPVYIGLGSTHPFVPNMWIILALALWAAGVHIQNVIPDFEHDAKTGIKGTANRLSEYTATLLTGAALVLSVGTLCVLYIGRTPLFIWVIVGIFAAVSMIFITIALTRNVSLAYKVSIIMTAIASLLIMLSGHYLTPL